MKFLNLALIGMLILANANAREGYRKVESKKEREDIRSAIIIANRNSNVTGICSIDDYLKKDTAVLVNERGQQPVIVFENTTASQKINLLIYSTVNGLYIDRVFQEVIDVIPYEVNEGTLTSPKIVNKIREVQHNYVCL